jgi:hypothetical protein
VLSVHVQWRRDNRSQERARPRLCLNPVLHNEGQLCRLAPGHPAEPLHIGLPLDGTHGRVGCVCDDGLSSPSP